MGTFASDYHEDLDDDDDEDADDDEDGACALRSADGEFDDDEPVLEICEPVGGGEAHVVTHSSQRAFEEAEGRGLGLPTGTNGQSAVNAS